MDGDPIIEEAQNLLEQKRDSLAAEMAKRLAHAPNGAHIGLGSIAQALGAGLAKPCADVRFCRECRARIFADERERGLCDHCFRGGYKSERREHMRKRVPGDFGWADLSKPLIPPGGKVPVVAEDGRRAALAWLASESSLLTIVGPQTGAGKTTLAAAVAFAAIDAGEDVDWIPASILTPDHPNEERAQSAYRKAMHGRFVVIDGLMKELGGAHADSGVVAQRQPWMQEVLNSFHSLKGRRVVLTVDGTRDGLTAVYGADAMRRIATPSNRVTVVSLKRAAPLNVVQF